MPKQKSTKVTVTALQHAIVKHEACIVLEMKIGSEEKEPTVKHGRDLDRALQTFRIYADTEYSNIFKSALLQGPYFIGDNEGLMAMVVLDRAEGVTDEDFSARVRTGVNGISSLLKHSGYGVKIRMKPVEQIPIPETDGAVVPPPEAPAASPPPPPVETLAVPPVETPTA